MARLVLLLVLLGALAFAVAGAVRLARTMAAPPPRTEDAMPAPVRTVAYVLLVVLLLGLASGWLGAA